jgi:hypothetical protein
MDTPYAAWISEINAYDDNEDTYTETNWLGIGMWSRYLYLTCPIMLCDRIRVLNKYASDVSYYDIGVYRDWSWVDIYEGLIGSTWKEVSFTQGFVTQLRIRVKGQGGALRLYEADFWDAGALAWVSPTGHTYNVWDDGYSSGGNYWSDYNGTDLFSGAFQNVSGSDGIGDIPFGVDINIRDNYPLMGSFSDFSVTHQEETSHITAICNSEISEFQFYDTAKIINFKVTGPDNTLGFCRVDIPNDLMGPSCTAFVDGYYPEYINYGNNSTHRWIYFTYQHSTHWVIITQTPPPAVGPLLLEASPFQ